MIHVIICMPMYKTLQEPSTHARSMHVDSRNVGTNASLYIYNYIYIPWVSACAFCVCVRTCTHYLWINSCPQVSMSTRKKAYIFTIIYSHTPHTSTGWWLQPLKNAFLSPWRICSSVFIIPFDLKIEKYIKILESTQHTNHTISNHQDTSRRIKIH